MLSLHTFRARQRKCQYKIKIHYESLAGCSCVLSLCYTQTVADLRLHLQVYGKSRSTLSAPAISKKYLHERGDNFANSWASKTDVAIALQGSNRFRWWFGSRFQIRTEKQLSIFRQMHLKLERSLRFARGVLHSSKCHWVTFLVPWLGIGTGPS